MNSPSHMYFSHWLCIADVHGCEGRPGSALAKAKPRSTNEVSVKFERSEVTLAKPVVCGAGGSASNGDSRNTTAMKENLGFLNTSCGLPMTRRPDKAFYLFLDTTELEEPIR